MVLGQKLVLGSKGRVRTCKVVLGEWIFGRKVLSPSKRSVSLKKINVIRFEIGIWLEE
ncbi:hypothetical protein QJS04_geneDACA023938 [Acorus gramineus]|uniref:Uncharacterized protein n=1 Tax=Acorus gramineus TaxID=55184 RepID=A0AAV9A1B4_ACOGR|nr:hypothetical protein QJS04_geneDACA023938 [Acorus gramineus]